MSLSQGNRYRAENLSISLTEQGEAGRRLGSHGCAFLNAHKPLPMGWFPPSPKSRGGLEWPQVFICAEPWLVSLDCGGFSAWLGSKASLGLSHYCTGHTPE